MEFQVLDSTGARKLKTSPRGTEFTTTSTGNIDDLDFSSADLIRVNNASAATIRGLAAGLAGQVVTIVSVGAASVSLSHQDTGDGTAANRLLNKVTSGVTPLAAGTGSATYQYDGTTARWRLVSHDQGAYIVPTFSAGDYTGSGSMTVTAAAGDVARFAYRLSGKTLTVELQLQTLTIGGTPDTTVFVALPSGYTIAGSRLIPCSTFDAGTWNNSAASLADAATQIGVFRDLSGANWAAGVNTTWVLANLSFEIA